VEQEHAEQSPHLRGAQVNEPAVGRDLERAQDPELDDAVDLDG
jgi:hypothetical protein